MGTDLIVHITTLKTPSSTDLTCRDSGSLVQCVNSLSCSV